MILLINNELQSKKYKKIFITCKMLCQQYLCKTYLSHATYYNFDIN